MLTRAITLVSLLLLTTSAKALTIDRPGPSSTISPGQNVPIFATPAQNEPPSLTFNLCTIIDEGNKQAGTCNTQSFNVADLINGRVTANVPGNIAPGSYRVVVGNAAGNVAGQPFVIAARPTATGPQSDPANDPRGFGLTLLVPPQVAAGNPQKITATTDSRFNEATQFNDCTIISAQTQQRITPCNAPGLGEIKITDLRAGNIVFDAPGNMKGQQLRVMMSVSSAGCRIDDNCFSDAVMSGVFMVVDPGQVPPPPQQSPPPPPPPPPAGTSSLPLPPTRTSPPPPPQTTLPTFLPTTQTTQQTTLPTFSLPPATTTVIVVDPPAPTNQPPGNGNTRPSGSQPSGTAQSGNNPSSSAVDVRVGGVVLALGVLAVGGVMGL